MKKIRSRAVSVLLVAALVFVGLALFVKKDYEKGRGWALYFSSFNSGAQGTILDRNQIPLARFNGTNNTFSEDTPTRIANYHVTGDYWGRTGTGVLSRYWSSSQEYDFLHGTTKSMISTLPLSIDCNINNKAYNLLREAGKGAVMICNYKTGEVVCMTSCPSVDPLDNSEPEDGAYINRCLSASYTPGSTFKLVTSAAAIETLPNLDSWTFYCTGETSIAGVPVTCMAAHGQQTFREALANSCNCAFAHLTVEIGQRTMIKYVTDYGFLDAPNLDNIPSVAGNYPLEFVGDPETAWSGIGQSVDMVCPYTMLRFVSAIANGGELVEPTLVMPEEAQPKTALLRPETARKLRELMINNVETHYEGDLNFPGLVLGAKTGTAETGSAASHSWFTGFLVDDAHPYAFVAIIENGGFGLWNAGMMINEILQYAVKR